MFAYVVLYVLFLKSSVTRHMTRMNGSYPRDQVPYTSIKPPTPTSAHSPGYSKEVYTAFTFMLPDSCGICDIIP